MERSPLRIDCVSTESSPLPRPHKSHLLVKRQGPVILTFDIQLCPNCSCRRDAMDTPGEKCFAKTLPSPFRQKSDEFHLPGLTRTVVVRAPAHPDQLPARPLRQHQRHRRIIPRPRLCPINDLSGYLQWCRVTCECRIEEPDVLVQIDLVDRPCLDPLGQNRGRNVAFGREIELPETPAMAHPQ